jgi:hypothetical protein
MEMIYVKPAKAGKVHHSSFLSGKTVICAGEIKLHQGQITHINNLSGHYLPTREDLLNCVEVLVNNYGVSGETFSVRLQTSATDIFDFRTATAFLRQRGIQNVAWGGRKVAQVGRGNIQL